MIYKKNLNLILLLLRKNLIYYVKGYNIDLNTSFLSLSQKDKIRNFQSAKIGNLLILGLSWFKRI